MAFYHSSLCAGIMLWCYSVYITRLLKRSNIIQFLKNLCFFKNLTHQDWSWLWPRVNLITSQTISNGWRELCHCHGGCVSLTHVQQLINGLYSEGLECPACTQRVLETFSRLSRMQGLLFLSWLFTTSHSVLKKCSDFTQYIIWLSDRSNISSVFEKSLLFPRT